METNRASTSANEVEPTAGVEAGAVVRTFLIADVRGYTRFTQAHGDEEAGNLAARFAALAREAVSATGGEVLELRGDEALCVFPSARQALRAAVELQARFRQRVDGESVFPLGIGIGLAAGEAVPVEGGYRGAALNLAARLCSLAAPGQILASEMVTGLAGTVAGVRFVERRRVRVKGLEKPVRATEVVPEIELPPLPETPRPSRRRPALLLLAAGVVVLAASLTAGILALTGDSAETVEAVGNAIAAIDGDKVTYTQVGKTPSTIAVGEGAVWVLNADDRTISKIDPQTKEVETFGTGGISTDLAVGEGAVWVGNGAQTSGTGDIAHTTSVSRVDPNTTSVTQTQDLPSRRATPDVRLAGEFRTLGVSQLAVGAGAVWAINPDLSVSRINPDTGKRDEIIPIEVGSGIAAGREGVWAIAAGRDLDSAPTVLRIDPRTNQVSQRIELATDDLTGLALGGGSVWATDAQQGLLWRIEPGPDPTTRTIDVGFGATAVTYGDGTVWVANFVRDEISRVDVRTNEVTDTIRLAGTPPSVAAAAGTAWVSIAGAPSGDSLPASMCGPVLAGGRKPDVLVVSDLPLQGAFGDATRVVADAIRFVLRKHEFKAGSRTVGYQSCDDSTAQTGSYDVVKCASNAKAYAAISRVVGVIGPFNSPCAQAQIPVANRAEGPLAMISPANTHPGLTHAGGADQSEGEPEVYYPTGVRNYVRVIAPDDYQAAAAAMLAQELGLEKLYIVKTTDEFPGEGFAADFKRAARRLGLTVAGVASLEPRAKSYSAPAARVARARPDGILFPELYFENPGAVLEALRNRLGREVVLIGNDFVGYAEPGMYVTTTGRANESLGAAGQRFLREFTATQPDSAVPTTQYIPEAAQAAEALLEAIERSDGTRVSVLQELRRLEIEDGILGTFSFDKNGDMTPAAISVYRVTGKGGKSDAPDFYGGADFDRLVRVPPELVRP
jgi:branched-chain amino acid transport system substrate-binding protein